MDNVKVAEEAYGLAGLSDHSARGRSGHMHKHSTLISESLIV
jgi:hypothetical protein